ncbi:MAG: hypothetical protein V4493_07575 [Pseudomonadota bacterium]
MQTEYLGLLSEPVQQFIHEVEKGAGVDIKVILDLKQNEGGTTGQGKLAIDIDAQSIQLFAPTNGYFPAGAVRHEVLHVQRFHVEGVPKLVLADNEEWDKGFSDGLGNLDNAVEHVVIVPVELQFHPERRTHWEAVIHEVCLGLPNVPEGERRIAVCLHWTFLRHVLPSSPSVDIVRNFANDHALLEMAEHFADQFVAAMASKEEIVSLLYRTFPEIPLNRAALEYINSITGTYQKPIP